MILIKHLYKNLLSNMRKIVRRFLFSDERNNKITKGSNSKNINDTKSEEERKIKEEEERKIKEEEEIKKIEDMLFNPLPNSKNRELVTKWERLTGKETIFVCFISDPPESNFYTTRILSLIDKINSLGYDYIIHNYKSDRNYFQNCCYKPVFINDILKANEKNLVWIDGDTNLKNDIGDFIDTEKDFDIGLVTYNGNINGFIASPLFIRNTTTGNQLIESWMDHCTSMVESGNCELDHDALKHVTIPKFRNSLKIKLNWNNTNDLHKGMILENVNSDVPYKREILRKMTFVNQNRPFNFKNNDFIIV
jgi:hypothetical protein